MEQDFSWIFSLQAPLHPLPVSSAELLWTQWVSRVWETPVQAGRNNGDSRWGGQVGGRWSYSTSHRPRGAAAEHLWQNNIHRPPRAAWVIALQLNSDECCFSAGGSGGTGDRNSSCSWAPPTNQGRDVVCMCVSITVCYCFCKHTVLLVW